MQKYGLTPFMQSAFLIMKIYGLFLVLFMAELPACTAGEFDRSNSMLCLLRLPDLIFSNSFKIADYDYSTDWGRFPLKTSWNPATDVFPMDLWGSAERLRYLVYNLKANVEKYELIGIDIDRIHVFDDPKSHNLTVQDFANQWCVAFEWEVAMPTTNGTFWHSQYDAMLLDGTLLTKKFVRYFNDNSLNTAGSRQFSTGADPSINTLDNMVQVRRKTLRKVNLQRNCAIAARSLRNRYNDSEHFELEHVRLSFLPLKSIESENFHEIANDFDWTLSLTFTGSTLPSKDYDLKMLSDGTILPSLSNSP